MKNLKVISKLKKCKNDYPVMFFYIIGNFVNAILVRLFTTGHFQLRSIFFDLAFIICLAGLSFLIKEKRRNLYYYITTFIMMLICIINSLYYNYYNSFASISLLATSVFVKGFGDMVVQMVVRLCDLSYLWIISCKIKRYSFMLL